MIIHPEGYATILTAFSVLFVLNLVLYFVLKNWKKTRIFVILVSLVFLFIFIQFFRSPARDLLIGENYIVSPADGEIVAIEREMENEFFKDERIRVSIYLSPFNVHLNRYPVSGKINYFKYHPGEYLLAWHPKSSELNERTTFVLENDRGVILVRQIAGILARRIVYYGSTGEEIQQGSELGFIKFGSRMDVFLPLDAEIKVEIGDKVKGGESLIAEFAGV